MTKPAKSLLVQELEQCLKKENFAFTSTKPGCNTAYLVDVMANLRKIQIKPLKLFKDLCDNILEMNLQSARGASQIHFVFDSYMSGSVKDSERIRRSTLKPIEINVINDETPLPVNMDFFWPSNSNKAKLQLYLYHFLQREAPKRCPGTEIVLSGTDGESELPCLVLHNGAIRNEPHLDISIEEADIRLLPHAVWATTQGITRIVILSNDTDVIVLMLHFLNMLKMHGLSELWIKAGVGNTTRYIPLHILSEKKKDICPLLPAIHCLTGCDITSKFGTKHAALKIDAKQYLSEFGVNLNSSTLDNVISKAGEYLVQVLKHGSPCKSMDELRYYQYHQTKSCTMDQLPPTSYATRGHILRAMYATHMQINCLRNDSLDPTQYGFELVDGQLIANKFCRLIPDDLVMCCTCRKCATRRCLCRKNNFPCCQFCKCQATQADATLCENPKRQ